MTKLEREHPLETRCVDFVEERGGKALKLVPLGLRGFPDRTILMRGSQVAEVLLRPGEWREIPPFDFLPPKVWLAEFKRRKKGVVSAQQEHWRRVLGDLGFRVYVIDDFAAFEAAWKAEGGR